MKKINSADDCKEWLEVLRFMLLGILTHRTGIVWDVRVDTSGIHFIFNCRWGLGMTDSCSTKDYDIGQIKDLLQTRMKDDALVITQRYWKRQQEKL